MARSVGLRRHDRGRSRVTDAAITSPERARPRKLVYVAVALYCALAWVAFFKLVDTGVNIAQTSTKVHYAEADARDQ